MPAANTDTMNIQLRDLGQQITDTVQVLLVLDQAGWHNSRGLRVPDNITLLPLPPYSPELNPVEMIWRYLRQHYLSNRQYRDHDALFEAGGKAWNTLGDEPNRISPSPCSRGSNRQLITRIQITRIALSGKPSFAFAFLPLLHDTVLNLITAG